MTTIQARWLDLSAGARGRQARDARWRCALFLLALGLAACAEDACLLNSECAADEICRSGHCEAACDDDTDCPADRLCSGGACLAPDPNARPRCPDGGCVDGAPADAAADAAAAEDAAPRLDAAPRVDAASPTDAGSGDAGDGFVPDGGGVDGALDAGDGAAGDAARADATAGDGAPPDGAPLDGGPDSGAVDGGPADAAALDGDLPPLARLGGTYAITHTVALSGSRDFPQGQVTNTIGTLVHRAGLRYRLEVFDPEGASLFVVDELDFTAPEAGRYQFEYARAVPDAPAGCARVDRRFQRGLLVGDAPPFRLEADEDLEIRFAGEDCRAEDALVRFTVRWVPIP